MVSAGLINGLLGLLLAGKGAGTIAAYCIVAGAVWVLWVVLVIFAAKRQKKSTLDGSDIRMAALVDERNGRGGGMHNAA